MPVWVLTIAYWFHLMATVVWVGGMIVNAWVIIPLTQKYLNLQQKAEFLTSYQKWFQTISWLSLFILGATGMFQMSEHPQYDGFLAVENPWSVAIFIKHVFILVLAGCMLVMNFFILPALKRIALKQQLGRTVDSREIQKYAELEKRLTWANIGLVILVLILTAWARSVS
jgi:uncharacterized membrane protein